MANTTLAVLILAADLLLTLVLQQPASLPIAHYTNLASVGLRSVEATGETAASIQPPTQLQAGAFPHGEVFLRWQDNANNETGYQIERATGINSTNWVQIATVAANSTTYTDSPERLDESYWYRVRAYDNQEHSAYSNATYNSTFWSGPNFDEMYLLVLINEARADPGRFGYPGINPAPPLAYNPLLAYAAHSHSQSILNSGFQIGHCDIIGRCPTERAAAVGYSGGVGENLIQGMTGPEWVESSHQAFMDSEGHRDNMLCACFNEAGMGHTYSPAKGGSSYWKGQYTETFSSRPDVTIPALPSGVAVPDPGVPATELTYVVNFYAADGSSPTAALVYINGVAHPMTLSSGHPSNGTYRYTTNVLPNQVYTYYFYFEYGGGQTARLPQTGTMSYPTIMSRDFIPMINR